eukprot:3127505-Pleurochrysis_carterae.AAC.1
MERDHTILSLRLVSPNIYRVRAALGLRCERADTCMSMAPHGWLQKEAKFAGTSKSRCAYAAIARHAHASHPRMRLQPLSHI